MQSGGNLAGSRGAKERDLVATLGVCDLVAIQGLDHRPEPTCPASQGSLQRKDKCRLSCTSKLNRLRIGLLPCGRGDKDDLEGLESKVSERPMPAQCLLYFQVQLSRSELGPQAVELASCSWGLPTGAGCGQ